MEQRQVLLVVGLPGSGKTHLSASFLDRTVHEDFLSRFFDGRALADIRAGRRVCLIDPRLCMFPVFLRVVRQIEKETRDIFLVLFENEPDLCWQNARLRADGRAREEQIRSYSREYSLDRYSAWPSARLPVWRPDYSSNGSK